MARKTVGEAFAPKELPKPYPVHIAGRGSTRVFDSGPDVSGTPLVLLHGWNIDARSNFGFAFNALAAERRVVMFDHHGHGAGVRSPQRFSIEDAATDVVSVLDAIGIDRAVIGGYSMGGAIAQVVALTAPERCEALVLMATAATFSGRKRERAQFATFAAGAKAMRRLPSPAKKAAFCLLYTSPSPRDRG